MKILVVRQIFEPLPLHSDKLEAPELPSEASRDKPPREQTIPGSSQNPEASATHQNVIIKEQRETGYREGGYQLHRLCQATI